MIWFLTGAALLYVWLGDYTEAAVLAAALIPIAGMDAYLHRRTQASTEGLSARLATSARVIRDGAEVELPAAELIPGDLAILSAGAYVPADAVILSGNGIQLDESALTGEAMPVRKEPLPAPPDLGGDGSIAGRHWAMAGTRLLTGEARLRIAFTGAETLYGEIARLSRASSEERTPLQQAIARLVRILVILALALCAVLAVVRYSQGYGAGDAILSAVTLAVAALPEEFPVVFSFFLGLGVYRLARRQALVRRAVVVENIGRLTCICTDKTGTLTEGRLALDEVLPAEGIDRETVLALGAAASRRETGDPLDLCLLDRAAPPEGQVEAVYPFTEDRRREVAVLRDGPKGWLVCAKGAPETILALSDLPEGARADWRARTLELAAAGHKVIALASQRLPQRPEAEPEGGYRFAGLAAFADPLRPGVAEAVARAQAAGIRVIMITGDHERTAAAIARAAGIGGAEPQIIDGETLAARLAAGESLAEVDAIARCTPSQKLALVEALRAAGEVVAVTGDGVNDAPALRGADIGIAMGQRGTRSAREAAAIVLLDDDFATIIRAIGEGRQLFTNLRLAFAYLLMVHAPLVLTAALIPLMGYPLLYLPLHIVWLELIMHPTSMLVFQGLPAAEALPRRQAQGRTRFFSAGEWAAIGAAGAAATVFVLGGYVYSLGGDADVAHARSMALAALIAASVGMLAALTRLRSRAAQLDRSARDDPGGARALPGLRPDYPSCQRSRRSICRPPPRSCISARCTRPTGRSRWPAAWRSARAECCSTGAGRPRETGRSAGRKTVVHVAICGDAQHRDEEVDHRHRQRHRHHRAQRPDLQEMPLAQPGRLGVAQPARRDQLEILAPQQVAVDGPEHEGRQHGAEQVDHQRQRVHQDHHPEEAQRIPDHRAQRLRRDRRQMRVIARLDRVGDTVEEEPHEDHRHRHHQHNRQDQQQRQRPPGQPADRKVDGPEPGQADRLGQEPARKADPAPDEAGKQQNSQRHRPQHDPQEARIAQLGRGAGDIADHAALRQRGGRAVILGSILGPPGCRSAAFSRLGGGMSTRPLSPGATASAAQSVQETAASRQRAAPRSRPSGWPARRR